MSITNPTKTKVVDNFGGSMTRYLNGDMNSGKSKYGTSFGYLPFSKPGNLTWQETATRVDSGGTVITDLIVAMKERVESGISYVYAVGHLGRVYKIQVNDPTTYNPDYDNPVLLTTLAINSPTFTRGGSIEFFGTTERLYIGHDKGLTRLDFNGTNETFVGVLGSYTQTVPRPLRQYLGKLYAGNGTNIVEIDSTATVTSYTKLSPGFPDNTQVRDMDGSSDGRYLQIVCSRVPLADITSASPDTTIISSGESYIFKWNGTDVGYTVYDSMPSFSLTCSATFGDFQYVFGYDVAGSCVFNPRTKIITNILTQAPLPNAVNSNGNILGWCAPEFVNGFLSATLFLYGALDAQFPADSFYRPFKMAATAGTDILKIPCQILVSNFVIGSVTNGYTGGVIGTGKLYFSTIETSAAPSTAYRLYKFLSVSLGAGTPQAGVYETQTELFSQKVSVKEIRCYTEPLVAGNAWQIDLIDSAGNVIANSTKTFSVGTTASVGDDRLWYNPAMSPSYAVGLRITNAGSTNMTFHKVELDYIESGE